MKGFVKFFLVVLILVTVYQFFFMVPTNRVENEAKAHAEAVSENIDDEAAKKVAYKMALSNYLDSMGSVEVFSIPMVKSFTYNEAKQNQLALGLDLKGGMSAVLQVDLKKMLITLANKTKDRGFNQALEAADKAQESNQSDYITLFADEYKKVSNGKKLSRLFDRNKTIGEEINIETSDADVISILRKQADQLVELTFNTLKARVDKLGVTQPNISLDAGRDLILVEVPGVDNPQRVREFLSTSAELSFWQTYRVTDPNVRESFIEADRRLKAGAVLDSAAIEEIKYDTIFDYSYDSLGVVVDSTMRLEEIEDDPLGVQGPLLSMLELNGGPAGFNYPQVVVGVAPKNKIRSIDNFLSREDISALFPSQAMFAWSKKPYRDRETGVTDLYELYMLKKTPGSDEPLLGGEVVTSASQSPDPTTGEPQVSLRMNSRGAKKWAEITTNAFNDNQREIAITLDNEVVSAPGVRGPITGGNSSISGGFTVMEAEDLSKILEVGKLPAKIDIIQESTVGPTLGQKNILASRNSLLVGFGILLVFMLFYYGGAGIFSIIALIANMIFIFGALASFGTVLTLPGFAGIVLTIGMAVDANVIIYERVKEELRAGKKLLMAVSDGFRNSYSAIIDANVTTILTAIVLAYFGLGPIKGFAVVLIIGVLSSLFTAVLLGKLMIDSWTKKRHLAFWTPASKSAFANLKINWLGKRKLAYVVSGVLIVAGVASIFTKSFDLGVDFKGGYSYNVEFADDINIDTDVLKSGLSEYFGTAPVVKAVSTDNTYNIVTSYLINDNSETAAQSVIAKMHEGLTSVLGVETSVEAFTQADPASPMRVTSSNKVGPTIADDIKSSSYYAGIFALLLIFLYIFIRFNKWQYSLGAVAALFHDSLVVIGLFSILHGIVPFSLEIDQAFIAAILTVIGYSINDTVVVFDRIREYMGIYTGKDRDDVINMAINSTFSRTVITSVTTLIVVMILFVFGGDSIKGFAFALVIGILVGTYSSIFIATPIVRDLSDDLTPKTSSRSNSDRSFGRAASKVTE